MAAPPPSSRPMMRAIKVRDNKARIKLVPIPTPPPTYLLAKVYSIALNPTDWQHIKYQLVAEDSTLGCDFAGTVVSLPKGDASTGKQFKVGDRIAAVTHGANFSCPDDGCFAEYAIVKADLVVKIPDELEFDKAATFPLGVSTVGQGLFQKGLKLRLPPGFGGGDNGDNGNPSEGSSDESVLIYGGSTATGTLAIQFAKLAGFKVLTTCSAKNFDLVKGLGASQVYDYKEEDIGDRIRRDTGDRLQLVYDCIGTSDAMAICAKALSSNDSGCRYATIDPEVNSLQSRPGVKTICTFMYTIFNASFDKDGTHFPASKEDFEFARDFFSLTERLLNEGKLKTHPEKVGKGGLLGALEGLKNLRDGKVSGEKLIYHVGETTDDIDEEVEI